MFNFDTFSKLFRLKLKDDCIEIEFSISNTEFKNCYMGKMMEKGKELFWYGFPDTTIKNCDFDNYNDFANAKIFNNKNLIEIWDNIELISIDGCEPEERLKFLIK